MAGNNIGREKELCVLFRIPGYSDDIIVSSRVAKNLTLATMYFCVFLASSDDTFLGHRDEEKSVAM